MRYRTFGQTGFRPSALGFGCMRLPVLSPDDSSQIDEALAISMIRYAIDHGVNYVDNAYGYHRGKSEALLGRALLDGYRDKVAVATKLPIYTMKEASEADKYFEEQLARLNTSHIEFYLLHNVNSELWPKVKEWRLFDWAEKKKADGKIGHFGFSFHDSLSCFKQVIDYYPGWEFCQVQYNYVDEHTQAGVEGVKYAADRGLGIVVMEPIRGGMLANAPTDAIKKMFDNAPVRRTPAGWALQWVWNQPEISIALSGMSTMEQVIENVRSAEDSGSGSLRLEEVEFLGSLSEAYRDLLAVPCTSCSYCMPCPQGIHIPEIFALYNEVVGFERNEQRIKAGATWYHRMPPDHQASACVECGQCEEKCPQHISIREALKDVHSAFGAGPSQPGAGC